MEINWSEILTAVLVALLPPIAVVLSRLAWAKGSELFRQVKEYSPDLADFLREASYFAVMAAEQMGLKDKALDKKKYALSVAKKYILENFGLAVDLELLDAAIEKAVWQEFNSSPDFSEYSD